MNDIVITKKNTSIRRTLIEIMFLHIVSLVFSLFDALIDAYWMT